MAESTPTSGKYTGLGARPWYDVTSYGATGDGTTDDTAAIQAAIDATSATIGGVVFFPQGTYKISSALVMDKYITLKGCGKRSSIITSAHAGDGITSTWTINSTTAVHINLEDLAIKNTNGANTGGGFVDVGGTFIVLKNVYVEGFKYGVIFDQTECAEIDLCDFESPLTGGVWLVDGNDHTGGANQQFTNRISITRCQFNANSGTALIDDGGTGHAIVDCNFNGWTNHIWAAAIIGGAIRGCQFEGATGTILLFKAVSFNGGDAVGSCVNMFIGAGTLMVPVAGQSCIDVTSLTDIVYDGVYMGNTAVNKVVNNANCNTTIALRIWNAGGGATFNANATRHFELNGSIGGTGSAIETNNFQVELAKKLSLTRVVVTYSASMTPDASLGNIFTITVTNGTAFTINAPTNPTAGQQITITIRNTSGGAAGAATWNAAFKMTAWTNPATANSRSIQFYYDGTNWIEEGRTAADVPN